MRYANPWWRSGCDSPAVYNWPDAKPVEKTACGRGVIVKPFSVCYDYLVDGLLVTQRSGRSPEVLENLVAVVLDGVEPQSWTDKRAKAVYERQACSSKSA